MMSPHLLSVLRQLSSETFLSGEAIARSLGCSRATVNNAIREAIDGGVHIHAVHGRGYRLAGPLSWLVCDRLAETLSRYEVALRCHDQIASTNADLMAWAQSGAPHRAVVTAEWQSQGRGRRGRVWHAGLGRGLMFSLLWRSSRPAAELSGLSLAVGVLLVETLHGLGVSGARVKWPNDILVDGAKLAGVLIELSGDVLGPSSAVIGVGINVDGGNELTSHLGQPVTDLRQQIGVVDRNHLLATLVLGLVEGLARFEEQGFRAFQAAWQACHAHQDREVSILPGQGEPIFGRAQGVDEYGALLLETSSGLRRFHSGEVSLRSVGP